MKKTKKAKSSLSFVELLMCSKKQKCSYDPGKVEVVKVSRTRTNRLTQGVVVVSQYVGKSVRDVATLDDPS